MNRAIVGRVVRYLLSAVIIVFLVLFARTVNWGDAWNAIRTASPLLLLAAIVANLSSLVFRGIRWWLLLRAAGTSASPALAMRATVAGAGLNNVLVANGGEAARAVFITRATRTPSSKVIATVALDRLFDPVGFVALLAFGVVALHLPPNMARLRWPALIALLLIVALMVWLVRAARTATPEFVPERRSVPRGWRSKVRAWLVEFGGEIRDLASGPRVLWILLLTLLAWLGQVATFALAAAAAHAPLPLSGNLAALLAVNVSLIVRPTPGNVGFFQLAYALATAPFGLSRDEAIAVSLLIQTLQIIPVTLLGVALAPEFLLKRKAPTPV